MFRKKGKNRKSLDLAPGSDPQKCRKKNMQIQPKDGKSDAENPYKDSRRKEKYGLNELFTTDFCVYLQDRRR